MLKSFQFTLYLHLLFLECRVILAILSQRTSEHVCRLVYLSLISVHGEIVVEGHNGSIIEIAGHHGLLVEERFKIAVFNPEKRIFGCFSTKVIIPHHHRTKAYNLTTESGIGLVIIGTLLEVIHLYLSRRDIAVVHSDLTIFLFVEDVIVVENGFHGHLCRIAEDLIAIQPIFIHRYIAIESEFEYVCEEVQLLVNGFHGIVEASICIYV